MTDSTTPDADLTHESDPRATPADPTPVLPTDTAELAPAPPARPRPIIERIGMAFVAVILAALFAVVGVAAFAGGEPFLGVMGAVGCLMVLWVGGLTLFKGR